MVNDKCRRWMVVTVAAAVFGVLTARLGCWQLDRAAQKQALQDAINSRGTTLPLDNAHLAVDAAGAAQQHYRPVRLQGRWLTQATVFLDNRQMGGRPGFFVVTPLELRAGDAVLVQRGWVPRDPVDRTRLPAIFTSLERVEVSGRVAPEPARLYEFANAASGPIRQNLNLSDFSREIGVTLRPLSIQQLDTVDVANVDGLQRHWSLPNVDVGRHRGYAFQWFALCALIVGLYVWFQVIYPWFKSRRAA